MNIAGGLQQTDTVIVDRSKSLRLRAKSCCTIPSQAFREFNKKTRRRYGDAPDNDTDSDDSQSSLKYFKKRPPLVKTKKTVPTPKTYDIKPCYVRLSPLRNVNLNRAQSKPSNDSESLPMFSQLGLPVNRKRKRLPVSSTESDGSSEYESCMGTQSHPFPEAPYPATSNCIVATVGQGFNECAGVALAVVSLYFEKNNSFDVNNETSSAFAYFLKWKGHELYELGIANTQRSATEAPRNHGEFIEVNVIYNERNAINENVLWINGSLKIEFETSECFRDINDRLTYRDFSTGQENFEETFRFYLLSRSNAIILCNDHYIVVIRPSSGGFMLVNSIPTFTFTFFADLQEVVSAVSSFVGGGVYTLHSVHATSRDTPPNNITNAEASSDSETENEEEETESEEEESDNDEANFSHDSATSESERDYEEKNLTDGELSDEQMGESANQDEANFNKFNALLSKTPVTSKILRVRKICAFESCSSKNAGGHFCVEHKRQVYKIGYAMSQKLRLKCPHDGCSNIVVYFREKCLYHGIVTIHNDEIEITKKFDFMSVRAIIEKVIEPLVKAGMKYYIGLTSSVDNRETQHIAAVKKINKPVDYIKVIPLMKVVGLDAANDAEILFIFEYSFHRSSEVRKNLLNSVGGGGHTGYGGKSSKFIKNDLHNLVYNIYVRYDKLNSKHAPRSIPDENISKEQLTSIFKEAVESAKIISKLKNNRCVYFGVTSSIKIRNTNHNSVKINKYKLDNVCTADVNSNVLVKVGKYKTPEGKHIQISSDDIRRIEMIAVYEFKFGEFSRYSQNLANVNGGGECTFDCDSFYYKMGSFQAEQSIKQTNVTQKYFNVEIPRKSNGKIDWDSLVPEWALAKMCGDLLQLLKEFKYFCKCGSKYVSNAGFWCHKKVCKAAGGVPAERFPCVVEGCKQTFVTYLVMTRHVKVVHQKIKRSFHGKYQKNLKEN